MKNKLVQLVSVLAVLGAISGCAATQEMEVLRAAVDQAKADAAQAQADAARAQSTADQAMSAAQNSQSCCDATNEKIDRMFKQSMLK